jgi:hypothetical protein
MATIKGVRRFDLGEIHSIEKTPQGFLKVPGYATRTGVFTYVDAGGKVRRELRHPDDVFDPESLATLKNAPVTLEHPPIMLTPENVKQYMKGYTTDRVEVDRDMVATDLIIAVEDAIRAVETHGMRELSSGYTADLEEVPGVYNGTQYDVRQRNIKYNHLAIVKKGRAGPEARLRMDSADAIMSDEVPNQSRSEFTQEGENDSEESSGMKTIVISGEKVSLPNRVADIVEDMMGRYDQLRGEVAKLKEESMSKPRKDDYGMKDVDISQKNVSPDVKVVQMAPDGRGESKKVGSGDFAGPSRAKGTADEEQHGVVGGSKPNSFEGGSKALQDNMAPMHDDDEDEKKKDKKDDEVAGDFKQGQGFKGGGIGDKKDYEGVGQAGVAMSPADRLKHEIEEMEAQLRGMKDKYDAMSAKLDEMANQSMGQGESKAGGEKMDSANWKRSVQRRVSLERRAEKLVPSNLASRFDSMSDHEIMATCIKHVRPNADLRGKSDVYLESRFDTIAEDLEKGESIRKEMGSRFHDHNRMDSVQESNPNSARLKSVNNSRNDWQLPLSAVKK